MTNTSKTHTPAVNLIKVENGRYYIKLANNNVLFTINKFLYTQWLNLSNNSHPA